MSDQATQTLDLSVTEALQLLANLNAISGGAAKSGAAAKPKWDYTQALQTAQPAIAGARTVAASFTGGPKYAQRMDEALQKAAAADTQKNAEEAKKQLDRAEAAARRVTSAAKADYATRKAAIEAPLATLEQRIGQLPAMPAVAQALQTAKTAQTRAAPPADDKPGDWVAANAALATFQTDVDAIQTACVGEARTKATGFDTRMAPHADTKPIGKDFGKKLNAYGVSRKAFDAVVQGGDGLTALERSAAVDAALTAFEQAAAPTTAQRGQMVTGAMATLTGLEDKDLAAKPLLEKAEIALDLCAAGTPTDKDQLKQLVRLYNNSKPDKAFEDKRATERQQIIDAVLQMPDMKGVFDKKGKVDKTKWKALVAQPDKMLALLSNICTVQCNTLGFPPVTLRKDPDPPEGRDKKGSLTFGGYDPANNDIGINLHKDCFKTIKDGLDTIIHETFHAHQDYTVKRLRNGDIKPTDPEYATAMMWLVNDIGVGYVGSKSVGQKNYEKQPTEYDSFHHAGETINGLLIQSKKNAKGG